MKALNNLDKSADEKRLSELMRKAQGGDEAAYRSLLLEVEKMLASFIKNNLFRLGLGNTQSHDDLLQEILLAIHTKRATYDPNQYFLPWMYAISRYKIIDHARATRTSSKVIALEMDLATLELPAAEINSSGSNSDVEILLNSLPKKQREILELVKIKGLSIKEAALHTGCSDSDVKVTIHRAIKTLQKKLKREAV